MADATIELDAGESFPQRIIVLKVVGGPHENVSWTFDRTGDFVIGRDHPAHIRLRDEPALSRQHFKLSIGENRVRLSDLKSTNGTWLNGIRVSSADISDGDRFGVGNTLFVIESNSDPLQIRHSSLDHTETKSPAADNDRKSKSPASASKSRIEGTRIAASKSKPVVKPVTGGPLRPSLPVVPAIPVVAKEAASTNIQETIDSAPSQTDFFSVKTESSIGTYEVVREIGQGGMATVFEVRHKRSNESFAMKLIRNDSEVTEKQVALFVREAGLVLKLVHPRIVRAYEFGFHGSVPFLVMELLPIIDLSSVISGQESTQQIRTSCWVISRVLQALHFAHQAGVVHRDIKLGNILAYRVGRHLQVKLGDFGLAKSFQDAGLSAMTNDRSIRGTLAYMAPEHLRDSRSAGPLVDLFSTGVCLYRLLTGKLPSASFKPDVFESELKQLTELPAPLQNVLRVSMHRDPTKRFQSAEEMAQALYPFHGQK